MKSKLLIVSLVLTGILFSGSFPAMAKASKKQISGHLNLNTASAEQLDQLPGISPKKASAIVDYRKEHPLKSVEELDNVKGFSPKSIEKLKPYVSLSGDNNLVAEGGSKAKKGRKSSKKKA